MPSKRNLLTFLFMGLNAAQAALAVPEPSPTARPPKSCVFTNELVQEIPGVYEYHSTEGEIFNDASFLLPVIKEHSLTLHDCAKHVADTLSFLSLQAAASVAEDINAKDANGKTALNILVEDMFATTQVTDKKTNEIAMLKLGSKLRAVDFLLANGATTDVLQSIPSSKDSLAKAKLILQKMQASNKAAPAEYLQAFAYYVFQNQVVLTQKLARLEDECNTLINREAHPQFAPLLIAEYHEDAGTNILVTKSVPLLKTLGFQEICLERPDQATTDVIIKWYEMHDPNHMHLHTLKAFEKEFTVRHTDINTLMNSRGEADRMLDKAIDLFDLTDTMLRDKGFKLHALLSALRTNGKMAMLLGGAHIPPIISFLKAHNIKPLALFPHTEPLPKPETIEESTVMRVVVNTANLVSTGDIEDLYLPTDQNKLSQSRISDFHDRLTSAHKQSSKPRLVCD